MFRKLFFITTILFSTNISAQNIENPIVLELFTSHGCSACPTADLLLKELAENNPNILAFSFHIDYWDNSKWKDPFSSAKNTARQKEYLTSLKESSIYTPQLIVNGKVSVAGSNIMMVKNTIEMNGLEPFLADVSLERSNKNKIIAHVRAKHQNDLEKVDIWEIRFNRFAKTAIKAGTNSGQTIENINNVTDIKLLKTIYLSIQNQEIALGNLSKEGIAILVQAPNQGQIYGAAAYLKN